MLKKYTEVQKRRQKHK